MLINENTIEQAVIATLQSLGWDYTYGKTILSGLENEWRERTAEVILKPILNERENIIVITDEAHRSQYGFNQKNV